MRKILFLLAVLGCLGLRGQEVQRKVYSPYTVYEVKLVPGVPLALEIPKGDSITDILCDVQWFKGEAIPDTNLASLKALSISGVVGRMTFFHILTNAGLRITVQAEAVHEPTTTNARMTGVLMIELDGSDDGRTAGKAIRDLRKARETPPPVEKAQKAGQEGEDLTKWKQETIRSLRESYRWGGDFAVERVVDDKLQTMIFMPQGSDRATIEIVDRSGHPEKVNYEFQNGVYTIQKVLRPGERFRLVLGMEQEVIGLK